MSSLGALWELVTDASISGKMSQGFWDVIDYHIIHAALHWAKQVMVEMWHVNCLVECKMIYLPIAWMIEHQDAADCIKHLRIRLWVMLGVI